MIGRGQDYLSTQVRRVAAAYSEYPESNVPLIGLTLAIMLIMMGVPELDSRPKGCSFDSQRLQRWFSTRHWKLQQRLSVQRTSYETRSNCSVRRENIYSFRIVDKGERRFKKMCANVCSLIFVTNLSTFRTFFLTPIFFYGYS